MDFIIRKADQTCLGNGGLSAANECLPNPQASSVSGEGALPERDKERSWGATRRTGLHLGTARSRGKKQRRGVWRNVLDQGQPCRPLAETRSPRRGAEAQAVTKHGVKCAQSRNTVRKAKSGPGGWRQSKEMETVSWDSCGWGALPQHGEGAAAGPRRPGRNWEGGQAHQ